MHRTADKLLYVVRSSLDAGFEYTSVTYRLLDTLALATTAMEAIVHIPGVKRALWLTFTIPQPRRVDLHNPSSLPNASTAKQVKAFAPAETSPSMEAYEGATVDSSKLGWADPEPSELIEMSTEAVVQPEEAEQLAMDADQEHGGAEGAPAASATPEGETDIGPVDAAETTADLTADIDVDASVRTTTSYPAVHEQAPVAGADFTKSSMPSAEESVQPSPQQAEAAEVSAQSPLATGTSGQMAAAWEAPAAAPSSNGDAADSTVLSIDAANNEANAGETSNVSVRELREQLSATNVSLAGKMAAPARPSTPPAKSEPALPISEHDKVNTVNVAALLASAEFKLVPGQDVLPYEQLVTLRLEDGIDVTRKEDYLGDDEFTTVFGCNRDAYSRLPQWKRLQLKRNVKLF